MRDNRQIIAAEGFGRIEQSVDLAFARHLAALIIRENPETRRLVAF